MTSMIVIDKKNVTREDLRSLRHGETVAFRLPDAAACNSGKSTVSQMARLLRCRFQVATDYAENILTVTRYDVE